MQEVYKWFLENWRIVLEIVILLTSVIIALVRKKPVQDIYSWISKYAIEAVQTVEKAGIVGSDHKLNTAVEIVRSYLAYIYPQIKKGQYDNIIVNVIESILETPQKKGEK